jgi:hypothetical protein
MSFFSRKTRRPASPKLRMASPRLVRLDDRLLLSGFGPQVGADIVEPWMGGYSAVQIQPTDQKILAAGQMTSAPGRSHGPVLGTDHQGGVIDKPLATRHPRRDPG